MASSKLTPPHKFERWNASDNSRRSPRYLSSRGDATLVSWIPYIDSSIDDNSSKKIPQLDGCVESKFETGTESSSEAESGDESGTHNKWGQRLTRKARRGVREIGDALRKINLSESSQSPGPVPKILVSPPSRTSLSAEPSGGIGEVEPVNHAHMIANRAGRVSYFTDRNFETLNVPPRAAPPNWQNGRLLPIGRGRKRTMTTKDLSVILNPRRQSSRNRSSK